MADFTPDELIQKKKEFAKRLIKFPTDPFKAATYIFPDAKDMGNRLIVAYEWPKDSVVIFEMDRLIDGNETEVVLPTKEQIAHEVYLVGKLSIQPEDKLKAFKLYSELQGFVKTPGVNISNTINNKQGIVADNVMLVPVHNSDEDWQTSLMQQQQKLISIDIEKPLNDPTANS